MGIWRELNPLPDMDIFNFIPILWNDGNNIIHILETEVLLSRKGGVPVAFSDLEILARILLCEAGGEGENGMKAVACVVMNRVQVTYGEYGRLEKTIRAIIYQPGQFDCVREEIRGSYNPQNIYNMRPTQVQYDIANWAIAGNRLTNLGFALWYFNPFVPTCRPMFPSNVRRFVIRIGNHCFYNPTEQYANT
jgi:N-acetylmuramoyl-L-alanine amidase